MHTPRAPSARAAISSPSIDKNRAQYERLLEVFRAHDIGYFFYNGGNDSADTRLKVSQISARLGYPDRGGACAQDRRQRSSHHRLLSRLRVGRQIRRGLDARSRVRRRVDGRRRRPAFSCSEVMGRHAGWITAAVGLADDEDDADSAGAAVPGNRASTRRGFSPPSMPRSKNSATAASAFPRV